MLTASDLSKDIIKRILEHSVQQFEFVRRSDRLARRRFGASTWVDLVAELYKFGAVDRIEIILNLFDRTSHEAALMAGAPLDWTRIPVLGAPIRMISDTREPFDVTPQTNRGTLLSRMIRALDLSVPEIFQVASSRLTLIESLSNPLPRDRLYIATHDKVARNLISAAVQRREYDQVLDIAKEHNENIRQKGLQARLCISTEDIESRLLHFTSQKEEKR